jgi:hypothetical protein
LDEKIARALLQSLLERLDADARREAPQMGGVVSPSERAALRLLLGLPQEHLGRSETISASPENSGLEAPPAATPVSEESIPSHPTVVELGLPGARPHGFRT